MAIPDVLKIIYDQIYGLLEARSVWASMVKDGNRIKLGAIDEQGHELVYPYKRTFQDGDFPQSVLIFGSIVDGLQPAQQLQTFAIVQGTCQLRKSEMNVELLLGISHSDLK